MNEALAIDNCSVIIIARNEERLIGRCLESVASFGEIIVVDDESTDRTPEICRSLARVKLFRRKMLKGFGPQKNYALSLATRPWVLSLDADEYLDGALLAEIAEKVRTSAADGFRLRRSNLMFGAWLMDHKPIMVRLFRRDKGRFTDRHVDEAVVVQGVVEDLRSPLRHTSAAHATLAQYYRVIVEERSLATARDLYARGVRAAWWRWPLDIVLRPSAVFVQKLFFKQGWRYGWRGVVLAFFSALAYARSYALLRKAAS